MMLRPLLVLFALVLAAPAVYAQDIYRSVMPDGKVVYGNKPEPGAKESKKANLPPPNVAAPPPAPDPALAVNPADGSAAANQSSGVAAARQNLEAAQKALQAGREQREGDRVGIAKGGGGTSRLTEDYVQRVKSLEDAVTAAQKQLDDAQRTAR